MDRSSMLYDEFTLSVSDIDFTVFLDNGFFNKGSYYSKKHFHKFHEIVYCYEGALEVIYDSVSERISGGDMIVIPKGTEHSLKTYDDSYYVVLGFWDGNRWDDVEAVTVFEKFPASEAFKRILEYNCGNYKYKKGLITACLCEIIAMMLEKSGMADEKVSNGIITLENNGYRSYIIEIFFLDSFCGMPKISELADLLHLSVQQTQRIIKKMYNMTFREYIAVLKFERAKSLLKETDMSIAEIAASVGYSNAHNLFKLFKDKTGITPSQYRLQKKNMLDK